MCARGKAFLCAFPPYTVHLCASVCGYCLPVLQQGLQSELFMRDLNTCKWFTPLPWHRSRLPMATAPSRSILPPSSSSSSSARFSQAPALQPCYLASRIVSTITVPGWVAAHCRVAGYPIIHSQGHKGREGGREKVGRRKEGSIPPSSSDGKFRRQHPAGGEE